MTYKWASPQEWLQYRLNACMTAQEARELLNGILDKLPADDIQDVYQSDMDEDGYFQEVEDEEERSNYNED